MTAQSLRARFVRKFAQWDRYPTAQAWGIVLGYVVQAAIAVAIGATLLALEPSVASVAGIVAAIIFIGTRLRGLNNIVHECSHASFASRRKDNVLIGKFCSTILTGCFVTYREDHLSHHAHLGDYEHDREIGAIRRFRLDEPLSFKTVLRHIVTPLLGRHLSVYSKVNLSRRDGIVFFGLKIMVLVGIFLAAVTFPLTTALFIILPLFYVFPTLNFWTDCLDHAGLVGEVEEIRASRNVLAPTPLRLLFFPRNDCYHLVHHLFPNVPARHLATAHRELSTDQEYAAEPLAVHPTLSLRPAAKAGSSGVADAV